MREITVNSGLMGCSIMCGRRAKDRVVYRLSVKSHYVHVESQ